MECLHSSGPGTGGVAIVNLFRATANGFELAAQLRIVKNGRVDVEVIDAAAKHYIADLRDHGIWSSKLGRIVHMDDAGDFLDAVVESVSTSSYWHAAAETPTPTHQAVLAEANN